jgi:hypothetical protein
VADTADINGGTIDGTAIGVTTPSTVTGTIGTFSSGFITNNANSATELRITNTDTGVLARARLAFVTDLGTSGFISYRRAVGDFIIGSDLNIPVAIYSNAAAVGTFTSTGLNSTAIGATTPSTGAFTTGSFSGTLFAGGVTTLRGANVPVANNSGFLVVGSSDAAAADLGGSIGFQANTTSLSNYPMGNISARLIATGAGVYRSYMAFATTDAVGSVTERMRLTDTGLAVTGALSTLATNGVNTFESSGISSVGLQFRTNSTNRFKIETPSASNDLAFYSSGTTEVARFSSTGLAVTGALSSTGALAIGNTVATAVAVASTHKVTIVIGGVTYYLLATNV